MTNPRQHLCEVHKEAAAHFAARAKLHGELGEAHAQLCEAADPADPVVAKIHDKVSQCHLACQAQCNEMSGKHLQWANELAPAEKTAGADFDLLEKLTGTEV